MARRLTEVQFSCTFGDQARYEKVRGLIFGSLAQRMAQFSILLGILQWRSEDLRTGDRMTANRDQKYAICAICAIWLVHSVTVVLYSLKQSSPVSPSHHPAPMILHHQGATHEEIWPGRPMLVGALNRIDTAGHMRQRSMWVGKPP